MTKQARTYIRQHPSRAVFVIGLLLVVLSMVFAYRYTAYNSDDVYWQNMLSQHWHPFSKNLFFGSDNELFILQLPIYWLVSLFVAPGRHAMLIDGVLLALINFTLFYASVLYFLRIANKRISYTVLLPVVWLASSGFGLSRLFLGTNLHTLAVGLIFTILMLTSKTCRGEFDAIRGWRRGALLVGIVLFVSFSVINDRYFLYFGILPALVLALLYVAHKRTPLLRLLAILGTLITSAVVYEVIEKLLPKAGIVLAKYFGAPAFIDFNHVGSSLALALHSFLAITGADFLGQPVTSAAAVSAIADVIIMLLVIVGSIKLLKNKDGSPEEQVFAGLLWFVLLALAFSDWNLDLWSYRYLAVMPFVAALVLAYFMSGKRLTTFRTTGYTVLLVVAVVLNLAVNAWGTATDKPSPLDDYNNVANFNLIDSLKEAGVSKGYSEYWSAQINSYLSGSVLNVEPVTCVRDGFTVPRVWFVNKDKYLVPSKRSFYIFDSFKDPTACTQSQVRQQFGAPARVLKSGEYTVYIYNYDLLDKTDQSWLRKDYP